RLAGELFQLGVKRVNWIGCARLHLLLDRAVLSGLSRRERFRIHNLLLRRAISALCGIQLADDARLQRREARRRFGPASVRLGNRPLVLVQYWQLDRQSESPFVLPLIVLVT